MAYAARIFGVTTNLSGIQTGLIANDVSWNDTTQIAEARNEKGELLDLASYSKGGTASINGLHVGSGIAVGSVVNLGVISGLVESTTKTENNTSFQTGSLSVRYGDDNTVLHSLTEIQGS